MERSSGRDVIRRCAGNPLIALADMPFRCADIWNAGVARVPARARGGGGAPGGQVLLLVTVETLEGGYSIYRAGSDDGEHFSVEAAPFMAPVAEGPERMYESVGIRDPRITAMDGAYYIAYLADGDHGQRLALARTEDFGGVERLGYVSQVDVKNGALFPRKGGGRWAMLKRPSDGASIWLAYSDDLTFWGAETVVMTPRGGYWDSHRIGPGAPPMEIDEGWLLIYYGERSTTAGPLVRLGAAILDRDDPARVVARSNIPILTPRERYERIGDVPNVVFSCGALLEDGQVKLYYGASDSCICLGTATPEEIVRTCFESEREY